MNMRDRFSADLAKLHRLGSGSTVFDLGVYETSFVVILPRPIVCVCAFDGLLLWVRIASACPTIASLGNTHAPRPIPGTKFLEKCLAVLCRPSRAAV